MAKNKILRMIPIVGDSISKRLVYYGWEMRLRRKGRKSGFAPLSEEQKREIREYWRQFGKRVSPKWAAHFSALSGMYDYRIIPESLYYAEIQPKLNNQFLAGLADKNMVNRIFSAKQPRTLLRRMNGEYFDAEFHKVTMEEGLAILKENGSCFIKPSRDSSYGDGTYVWSQEQGTDPLIGVFSKLKHDLIIQEIVQQHDDMAKFHPSSLNTVRVVSLRINDDIVILNAILRMGVNNSIIDNYSAGGVIANLKEDGSLFDTNVQSSGKRIHQHPDTHVSFSGQRIPFYDRIIREIRIQHNYVPFFRLISWDFAVDKQGDPVLIEGNYPSGQLDLHQLNKGGLFGQYTDQILKEVYLSK